MDLVGWCIDGGTVVAWLFNTVCKEHGEGRMRNECPECVAEALSYEREQGRAQKA